MLTDNQFFMHSNILNIRVCHGAQLVMCLAADTCLTADPGVASSIPLEVDHEIILPSLSSLPQIQKELLSVTRESMCTNC